MQKKEFLYNGKRIAFYDQGAGPVVVLLHGFAEDSSVWKGQAGIFPQQRVLLPDLPGSGESEAIDDMSIEGLADAVNALITEAVGEEKICLIGHSMGGYIALAFAEKYPERLLSFGLFHSTAFADTEEKKQTRRKGIQFIEAHGAAEFLKTATPNLFSPSSKAKHPEWIDELLAATHNFSGASLVSYYKAMMARPDRTAVLKTAKVPVLFVMGRHDTAVPIQDGLKQCHLPQIAYIHVLERSGHMGMIEEKETANKILSGFVNATVKPVYTV